MVNTISLNLNFFVVFKY